MPCDQLEAYKEVETHDETFQDCWNDMHTYAHAFISPMWCAATRR